MSLSNRLSGLFRYFIFALALLPAFQLSAQELVVESMTETADIMVVDNQKTDLNGNICAIVRVMLPVEQLKGRRVPTTGFGVQKSTAPLLL